VGPWRPVLSPAAWGSPLGRVGALPKCQRLALRQRWINGPVRHHRNIGGGVAHILRLILLSVLVLLSGVARAYPAPVWYYTLTPPSANYPTTEETCRQQFDFFNTLGDGTYSFSGVGIDMHPQGDCIGTKTFDGSTSPVIGSYYGRYVCPQANSQLVGTECVCSSDSLEKDGQCKPRAEVCEPGFEKVNGVCTLKPCAANEVRINNVCVKEPDCPAGKERVNGVCKETGCEAGKGVGEISGLSDNEVKYFCSGGCQAKVRSSVCVSWGGKTDCSGSGYLTGARCTTSDSAPPASNPPPTDTPPGDNPDSPPGDGGDGGSGDPEGPGTGGAGGGSGPGTGTGGDGTGGTTSPPDVTPPNTDPSNPDNPSGNGYGTPSEPKEPNEDGTCPDGYHKQGAVCISDPKSPDSDGNCPSGFVKVGNMCYATYKPGDPNGDPDGEGDGDKDAFGGSCDAGFTCKGDVIQCAIAQEQHKRNCQLYVQKTAESKLYLLESVKTGNRTLDLPGNETIDLNGRIDTTDALGGGSGVQDLNITVAGQSITLPFSVLNSPLAILGNILVAISFLLAFRIVGRG